VGHYRNPVLPGCHPDPSVCRVGDEFFLVTSTFEMLPGLPVHRSRNLVDWELVGHAVHRPDQLDLSTVPSSGGLFAPTIRHHDGRFHVVCTVVHGEGRQGHFLVTATDAAGPWSDPIWFDGVPGIDPSLTFDEGRVWLCGTRLAEPGAWEGQTEVWLRELDPESFAPMGREHLLWRGALVGARWAEGPHLFRRHGRWLLLAAEGGTERDHAVVVAYADEITGPYVGDPGNPRLTHRDLGSRTALVDVGHADLVDDIDGRSWAVLLATRTVDGRRSLLGRQTCLVPIEWEAGRPLFAPGVGRVLAEVESDVAGPPDAAPAQRDAVPLVIDDGRGGARLALEWNGVRRLPSEVASIRADGVVRIAGGDPPDRIGRLAFLGARLPSVRSRVRVRFEVERAAPGFTAGLLLRHSEDVHLTFTVREDAGARRVRVSLRAGGDERRVAEASAPPAGPVELVLEVDGFTVSCTAGAADGRPEPIGAADVAALSPDVAGGFLGVWAGVLAVGDGSVRVDVLEVIALD
jgi:alpha-N-arabinofuranosidase